MKAPFSPYLDSLTPGLKELIRILGGHFDYVSALATDSKGLVVTISQHSKSVGSQTMTTERGIVLRVRKDGLYSEYALNRFDPADPEKAKKHLAQLSQFLILGLQLTDHHVDCFLEFISLNAALIELLA